MKILAIFSGVMVALILASAPPAHAYSHAYSHGSSRLYSYASRATSASHSRSSSKAHRGSHRESHQESHRGAHQESLNKSSHRCFTCKRDRHGHIRRSGKARSAFEHSHPCPATGKTKGRCAGYVVDHVVPLECGGADVPSNMQWQSKSAAKAKDKTEGGCKK